MFFINVLCCLYYFKIEVVIWFFISSLMELSSKSRRTTTNFQIDGLKFFEYK